MSAMKTPVGSGRREIDNQERLTASFDSSTSTTPFRIQKTVVSGTSVDRNRQETTDDRRFGTTPTTSTPMPGAPTPFGRHRGMEVGTQRQETNAERRFRDISTPTQDTMGSGTSIGKYRQETKADRRFIGTTTTPKSRTHTPIGKQNMMASGIQDSDSGFQIGSAGHRTPIYARHGRDWSSSATPETRTPAKELEIRRMPPPVTDRRKQFFTTGATPEERARAVIDSAREAGARMLGSSQASGSVSRTPSASGSQSRTPAKKANSRAPSSSNKLQVQP